MIAERPIDLGEFRLGVICGDLFDQCGVIDLNPEVIGVGERSVMAVVGLGYNNREHFALGTRKRRFT